MWILKIELLNFFHKGFKFKQAVAIQKYVWCTKYESRALKRKSKIQVQLITNIHQLLNREK